jgi:hypothetical protein
MLSGVFQFCILVAFTSAIIAGEPEGDNWQHGLLPVVPDHPERPVGAPVGLLQEAGTRHLGDLERKLVDWRTSRLRILDERVKELEAKRTELEDTLKDRDAEIAALKAHEREGVHPREPSQEQVPHTLEMPLSLSRSLCLSRAPSRSLSRRPPPLPPPPPIRTPRSLLLQAHLLSH